MVLSFREKEEESTEFGLKTTAAKPLNRNERTLVRPQF